MPLVRQSQLRRAHVVAAAPHLDLVLAVLDGGLLLVETLQRAVVALVQPPAPLDRNPRHLHRGQRELRGLDGAKQQRLLSDGRTKPASSHHATDIVRLSTPASPT